MSKKQKQCHTYKLFQESNVILEMCFCVILFKSPKTPPHFLIPPVSFTIFEHAHHFL